MAEAVKVTRPKTLISVGDRVSVNRTYFDKDDYVYSQNLPNHWERLWDSDSSVPSV